MHHGRTSDIHDHANAALSNPILLWSVRKREGLADTPCTTVVSQKARGELSASVRVQTQNRKVLAEALPELETSLADPVDQHLSDSTLAAQGEDCGVTRVVVNHQQKVALVTLPTDGVGPTRPCEASAEEPLSGGTGRSEEQPGGDPRHRGHRKVLAGGKGRERLGKTRDKDTGSHAPKTGQGGAAKTVVPQESLAAKAALGGVGTPTLLTRAIARAKDVGTRTSTPTPLTPSVPLTELLRRRDVTRTLLLLLLRALTTTTAAPLLGTASTSSTSYATTASSATASPTVTATTAATTTAAATTAASSAAATTTTTTPATTPAATPTPSAASTATSTVPSSSTSALAPLALARAASPTRGRRRANRLETKQVGSSSRGNRGQEGGRRAPLKDGCARVTTRSSYSDDALLRREEGLLEDVDGEGGGTDCEKVVPDYAKGVREARDYVVESDVHGGGGAKLSRKGGAVASVTSAEVRNEGRSGSSAEGRLGDSATRLVGGSAPGRLGDRAAQVQGGSGALLLGGPAARLLQVSGSAAAGGRLGCCRLGGSAAAVGRRKRKGGGGGRVAGTAKGRNRGGRRAAGRRRRGRARAGWRASDGGGAASERAAGAASE
ncbi:unnamed protein product [Closterium sp. NIES-64]|nr:unnamed protein product [Closterium sp. NIES-64]